MRKTLTMISVRRPERSRNCVFPAVTEFVGIRISTKDMSWARTMIR